MYDLELPLSEIQGYLFFKCRENDEIQFSNDYVESIECLEALSLLGLRIHAPVHLLTYLLTQNNCDSLACDLVYWYVKQVSWSLIK